MSGRRQKQNELYWEQKKLRNMSMLKGDYEQITKMRKKQDDLYKMHKFYQELNNAREKVNKDEFEIRSSKKMQGNKTKR